MNNVICKPALVLDDCTVSVSVYVCDLLSQQRLQDGQVSSVLQGEDDDLARVVEPWSSSHIELRAMRQNN